MDDETRSKMIRDAQRFVAKMEDAFKDPDDPSFDPAYQAYVSVKVMIKSLKEN